MMEIDVCFSVAEVDPSTVSGRVVVVVDVVRATSSIVEALANGARAIYPTTGTEEAIKLANSLGREDTLLCGERKGRKIEGYDLGNSPAEFTRDRVDGKRLVMNTTNGTRAFLAVGGADRVVAGSFLNLGAVARAVAGPHSLLLVCAGREDRFCLEDAVCAGQLVGRLVGDEGREEGLGDAARAAHRLARDVEVDGAFLASTQAGEALAAIGLEGDLELCARTDRHALVPEMHDRVIRPSGSGG
jgi:2-phosphosulfolactate phosphatase